MNTSNNNSNNDQKLKVLFFGRIGDEVDAFVAKLTALHGSKAGPFDAAFTVGACNVQMLINKTSSSSSSSLPMPVYIQEPLQSVETLVAESSLYQTTHEARKQQQQQQHDDQDSSSSSSSSSCLQLTDKIFVLRNATAPYAVNVWSVTVTDKRPPLIVAACPSHVRVDNDDSSSSSSTAVDLMQAISHVSYTGCDVLLTTEWPQGVEGTLGSSSSSSSGGTSNNNNNNNNPNTNRVSFDVAQVALRARARYHVAVGDAFGQSQQAFAHLAATTNTVACYHTGRFLALASVQNATAWKAVTDKKAAKFVHALALQPLHTLSATELQAQWTAQSVLPCPYTDESYQFDNKNVNQQQQQQQSTLSSSSSTSLGLSEAQARRILAEEQGRRGTASQHRFGHNNRGGGGGRQGGDNRHAHYDPQQETIDPTNQTLFLHGLHQDVTGILQSNRGDAILVQALKPWNATGIRKPPGAATTSFCFADFPSHDAALRCWTDLQGRVTVNGVDLTVRWATHKKRQGAGDGDHENDAPHKKRRLTEAEARDSSTAFFTLGPGFKAEGENTLQKCSERLRLWMEETLEEALAGGGERVKAADEPALQVQLRLPETKPDQEGGNFGFLEFASHAAASMALATLTGSTDGGMVLDDAPGLPSKDFGQVRLHWGHAKPQAKEKEYVEDAETGFRFERKHFPADSRKDCWFCLASEACEKHLITGVYDQCYSAMPKGPIHEGHVLLVPVQHTSQGALKDATLSEEIDRIKATLREHASREYDMDLFVFERAIQTKGGYHTHVQCIPVPRQKGAEIRAVMIAQGRRSNADIRELTSDLGLSAVMNSDDDADEGYFYAEVPISTSEYRRFLYKATKDGSLPLQFGREVVATVLRQPDLAHWKSCVVEKDKESELAGKLRQSLAQSVE